MNTLESTDKYKEPIKGSLNNTLTNNMLFQINIITS